MESRRDFLKKVALFSGAAGLANPLLESIARAAAIEPAAGSTFFDAEHVVILMQENRSFDHAYGTLRGVRGYNDPRALKLPNGNPVWVQTNSKGESYSPFRLGMLDSRSTWMGCLPHGWTDQVDARNGGHCNRWLDNKKSGDKDYADMPLTLGYYNRADIPFYYALADAFTVCDQNFCSTLTGTMPNRNHLWTGTIRGREQADSWAHVLNSDSDYASEVEWPAFAERLEDLGVSWKIYQNELSVGVGFEGEEDPWLANFGDNPIEYFRQFHVRFSPAHRKFLNQSVSRLEAEIAALEKKEQTKKVAKKLADKTIELDQFRSAVKKWSAANYERLSPREKSLHQKAFVTNVGDPDYHSLTELEYQDGDQQRRMQVPKGDLLYQFRKDVADGALPTVSWVVPPERYSDHPCSAWYGAWYLAEMLDILTKNPEVWKKTIFILTYDENDGYFDHVPPFVAPHPERPETGKVSASIDARPEFVELSDELKRKPRDECRDSPMGLGYRVPLVIASPWSRGGNVCSEVFDHTSSLQFLEKFLSHKLGQDVRETNINDWRRAVCGDLSSTFQNFSDKDTPLPFFNRDTFLEQIHKAQFEKLPTGYKLLSAADIERIRGDGPASKLLPEQEPGVRRSCPLPYELAVDGNHSDDGEQFTIHFAAGNERFGKAAAGAPFIAYARRGGDNVEVRNYAVAPGDQLVDSWPLAAFADGKYHVEVFGPNGFYREFHEGGEKQLDVRVDTPKSGDVVVQLTNRSDRPQVVELRDLVYHNAAQQSKLAPGASTTMRLETNASFGWYDFAIRIAGDAEFEHRYAGRIETGQWSFSDPAMGRV
ncbi:MAG: phosphocholine-specific phospholipase C [Pirellulales bacterium]